MFTKLDRRAVMATAVFLMYSSPVVAGEVHHFSFHSKPINTQATVQPFITGRVNNPSGGLSAGFLTSSSLPLQVTITPTDDYASSYVEGGADLLSFITLSFSFVEMTFEMSGAPNTTNGPWLYTDGYGWNGSSWVNLPNPIPVSSLKSKKLSNGYVEYLVDAKSYGFKKVRPLEWGIVFYAPQSETAGPWLLNNFVVNDVSIPKVMEVENLSPYVVVP